MDFYRLMVISGEIHLDFRYTNDAYERWTSLLTVDIREPVSTNHNRDMCWCIDVLQFNYATLFSNICDQIYHGSCQISKVVVKINNMYYNKTYGVTPFPLIRLNSDRGYRVSNINIYIIWKPYQISLCSMAWDIWYGFNMMYILIFDTLY